MKIGIISDTHDDIHNVQNAIEIFIEEKVDWIIHAGDFIFPGVIDEFKKLKNELPFSIMIGVLGNNDGEKLGLLKKFTELDGKLEDEFEDIVIDGLRFGICHGTSEKLREAAIKSGIYDVFIHGHTHKRREDKIGQTLVLNPGTAHKKVKSVSGLFEEEGGIIIFNTQTKECKYIPLP
jgi:putative phosphoesterase